MQGPRTLAPAATASRMVYGVRISIEVCESCMTFQEVDEL